MSGYTFTANWISSYRIVGNNTDSWNYSDGIKSNIINPSSTVIKYESVHFEIGEGFKLFNGTNWIGSNSVTNNHTYFSGSDGNNIVSRYYGTYDITFNGTGISAITIASGAKEIVFNSSTWQSGGQCWIAVYMYKGDNNTWIRVGGLDWTLCKFVLSAEELSTYDYLIFVRMKNTDTDTMSFDNCWNQNPKSGGQLISSINGTYNSYW